MKRRDFLKLGAATGAIGAAGVLNTGCRSTSSGAREASAARPDPQTADLAAVALDAARDAGADYADCRIADYRTQTLRTREARVTGITDREDRGFGVRVLVDGTWGFAASPKIDRDELASVARRAVAMARANARLQLEPVELAPVTPQVGVWNTPVRRDAFDVPLDEKIDLLLSINAACLEVDGVSFANSSMMFVREHKLLATTDGALVEQTFHRLNPTFTATSVDREKGFQSRNAFSSPAGHGLRVRRGLPLARGRAPGRARRRPEKHDAHSVDPGPRDLILVPDHLWLTIHESIGHPTEYDRALGMEANYAGTSFLTPDKLGTYRLGSEIVNFVAEKTERNGLATCGWDDDGVPTTAWHLVKDGVFVDYQITRDQAPILGRAASYGCSYAQSWRDVPFQRMPNINLTPSSRAVRRWSS